MNLVRPPLGARWLGILLLLAAGCSQVEYIQLEPSSVLFKQANNKQWLSAKGMSHTGVDYPGISIGWSVKDPTIAKVDQTGLVVPLKSGMTEVTATHGKVSASAIIDVRFAEKLVVEPTSLVLQVGSPGVEVKAKVYDYQGRELNDRSVMYHSLDQEIVTMGQNAAFGMNPGKTKVEARVESLVQTLEVTVEPEKTASTRKK